MSIMLPFIQVTMTQTSELTQFSFAGLLTGDGFATGGRVLPLSLRAGLALAFAGGRFVFRFVALFELPLLAFLLVAGRLLFALRFPALAFELSFAFLFVFLLRLGLFSFAAAESLLFRTSALSAGVGSGVGVIDDSPSLTGRLISIAIVWPAFTTSPPRGN